MDAIVLGNLSSVQSCSLFNIVSISLYLKQHHVRSIARMRIYARFSLVPSKLCCYSETTEDLQGNKAHTHSIPSDYVFSFPCNKEIPKTSKPLQRGG
jgi:hypothetical protein